MAFCHLCDFLFHFFTCMYMYTSKIHTQVRVSQLHQETQVQQGLYFPAACMPKITLSNNPIVAVDPNPMGVVCVHSSASLGFKSTSYPALYFSFLFTHAFRCYEAMRWQDILGAAGLLARLPGTAALNWIPTWSGGSGYWISCVFKSCSLLIWSNTHPTSWESEQAGNKRELVGVISWIY